MLVWGWHAAAFQFGVIFVYVCIISKPQGFLLERAHKAMSDGQARAVYTAALNGMSLIYCSFYYFCLQNFLKSYVRYANFT